MNLEIRNPGQDLPHAVNVAFHHAELEVPPSQNVATIGQSRAGLYIIIINTPTQ